MSPLGAVLGIDPGRSKAGFAVVTGAGAALVAGVVPAQALADHVATLLPAYSIEAIALGRGTHSAALRAALARFGLPIHGVDEFETSRLARTLYFAEHPPRGWRRLVPVGLQVPPRPVDDYAAIAIARRFLARGVEGRPPS